MRCLRPLLVSVPVLMLLLTFSAIQADQELPEVVNLCDQQTPFCNQGGRDSCTYHPPIAALEAAYARAGYKVRLSVEHLIWLRNTTALNTHIKDADINENNLAILTGGGLSVNFDLLARYGVCRAESMPYLADHETNHAKYYPGFDVADYRWWEPFRQVSLNRFNLDPKQLPPTARADARYGIKEYVFLHGADCRNARKLEEILAAGHEIAINMMVTFKPIPGDQSRGDIPPVVWYRRADAQAVGGISHAMLLVGYDRKRQFLIVKNSWGRNNGGYDEKTLPEGWKDIAKYKGYTLIHYNYLSGMREAAYIKSLKEPGDPSFLHQRALGFWQVKLDQKSTKKTVATATLAWRRLPTPKPERDDLRIGDWYGPDNEQCRVNVRLNPAKPTDIILFIDPQQPQLPHKGEMGYQLRGKLELPESDAGSITNGVVAAHSGIKELYGVAVEDLTFTAKQQLEGNPLAGVEPNPNLLVNGSFEEGPPVNRYVPLDGGSTAIKGWIVTGDQIDYIYKYWTAAEGAHSIDLHGSPGYGGIAQTFATEPGRRYRVTFAMAGTPSSIAGNGGVKHLVVHAADAKQAFSFDTNGKSGKEMGWENKVWVFTATEAKTTLEFRTAETKEPETGPALDNVRVVAIPGKKMSDQPRLTEQQASAFARLALKGIQREYPNKPEHVVNAAADVKSPKALHPAFYGCFDWHSSVHGHWMLARLLRQFPNLPEAKQIRAVLAEHLTADHLKAETDYFSEPNRQSFERTYGWAWLLKLAEELHGWNDPEARQWSKNLQPLADIIVARYLSFLPKQNYPIRTGVHSNTAFGLAFAYDYARAIGNAPLRELIIERARSYFAKDASAPASWEPGGEDFFSPSLMEADLMRRVLPAEEFPAWLTRFLPELIKSEPKSLLTPAVVTDRSDPKLVHLDGLNLSRAWCMRGIARALPENDLVRNVLTEAAIRHAEAGLAHVASGDYAGEHWLASFAVYLLSSTR